MQHKDNLTKDINNLITEEVYDLTNEETESESTVKRTIISDSDIPIDSEYLSNTNKNKKLSIILSATPVLIAAIVSVAAYRSGYIEPKSDSAVDNRYVELSNNSTEYNSLLSQVSELGVDIDDLTHERDSKQSEYNALLAYRSGESSTENELSDLQNQLDELTKSNEEKQAQIDSLTADIAEKASTIMNLTPGIYTVGENIIAGKYTVTGSGSIMVSSSKGSMKLNTILKAEPTEITLDDGDKIQLDTRAKFTPSN